MKTMYIEKIEDLDELIYSGGTNNGEKISLFFALSKEAFIEHIKNLEKELCYHKEFVNMGEIKFVKKYGIDLIYNGMRSFSLNPITNPINGRVYANIETCKTSVTNLRYEKALYTFIRENGIHAFFNEYFPEVELEAGEWCENRYKDEELKFYND